jgi:hypothetical protein
MGIFHTSRAKDWGFREGASGRPERSLNGVLEHIVNDKLAREENNAFREGYREGAQVHATRELTKALRDSKR